MNHSMMQKKKKNGFILDVKTQCGKSELCFFFDKARAHFEHKMWPEKQFLMRILYL